MGIHHSKKTTSYHCVFCNKDLQFKKASEFNAHTIACSAARRRAGNLNSRDTLLRLLSDLRIASNELNAFERDSEQKRVDDHIVANPKGTFEQKVKYLHQELKKIKIDWRNGADTITIDREDIINQSIEQFANINPLKELKIGFIGEVNQDAGGLIREWLTVLFKLFLDEKYNMFEKADTDDISYLVKRTKENSITKSGRYYFIGQILAKALLENITVNCCFNKLIYKIILDEKVELEDLVFIDKPLYHSLEDMRKMQDELEQLEVYFNIQYENEYKEIITDDLISNGSNIKVTKDNIDLYIDKRIEYLKNTQLQGVEEMKEGLFSIIKQNLIKIFTCDELALLINGTPFIDLEDWRLNATYKNYKNTDQIILNFWSILDDLSQEELSKLLQFCTGSSRVPIGGFGALESNRGNISKFCITRIEYTPNSQNFIKAHTCFNRLDVPNYPNRDLLAEAIKFILTNETLGFGIE